MYRYVYIHIDNSLLEGFTFMPGCLKHQPPRQKINLRHQATQKVIFQHAMESCAN